MKTISLHALELKIPPPAIAFIAGFSMWLTAHYVPSLVIALTWRMEICTVLIIAGGCFDVAGIFYFLRAKTTINPLKPGASTKLVSVGVYRYSRNPMYFGLLLVLTGWATYLSHALAFLFLPLFVAFMNRFQIAPEERVLSEKFGPDYFAYMQSVRRWI